MGTASWENRERSPAARQETSHLKKIPPIISPLASAGQPLTALKLMESGGVELAGKLDKDFYLMVSGRLSAVALAEHWLEHEIVDVLRWLLARTQGVIRYLQADMPLDKPWSLMSVSNCMDLFGFLDTLSILMLKIDQGAVPNRQLVLEDILFQSCDIYHHQ